MTSVNALIQVCTSSLDHRSCSSPLYQSMSWNCRSESCIMFLPKTTYSCSNRGLTSAANKAAAESSHSKQQSCSKTPQVQHQPLLLQQLHSNGSCYCTSKALMFCTIRLLLATRGFNMMQTVCQTGSSPSLALCNQRSAMRGQKN